MKTSSTTRQPAAPAPLPAIGARTVNDACRFLGIGPTSLYGLMKSGKLDARKIGKRTIITEASLQALLGSLPRMVAS